MKCFNEQNTENFDSSTLELMNSEFELAIADLDSNSVHYQDELKNIGDQIFNKYC